MLDLGGAKLMGLKKRKKRKEKEKSIQPVRTILSLSVIVVRVGVRSSPVEVEEVLVGDF